MATVTLSSKYQVVIPKELRKNLNIKPGQKLRISKTKDDKLVIDKESVLDGLYGSAKGAWGDDVDEYIRKSRDEWEEHQKQLDKIWHDSKPRR